MRIRKRNRYLFVLHPRNPRNPRPILVPLCQAAAISDGGATMSKPRNFSSTRRGFLKGAAAAGAASIVRPLEPAAEARRVRVTPPLQDPRSETGTPAEVDVLTTEHSGSDFMVDVLRSLEI